MIWKQDQLARLNEEELRTQVLIPLFKAMGYEDVRHYHGGALERGKDIVMWKEDPLRGREHYAVVVKAEPLSGSAEKSIGTVVTQIAQCFGSSVKDPVTGDEHRMDHCFVVSSHEMKKEAIEALRNALSCSGMDRRISTIDGPKLWELLVRFFPARAVLGAFRSGYEFLEEASPSHEFYVGLGPDSIRITSRSTGDNRESAGIRFEPNFPDTKEGQNDKTSYEKHMATGESFTVKAKHLRLEGLPEPLAALVDEGVNIKIEARQTWSPLPLSILSRNEKGEETVLFPYVEFRATQIGEKEATLENDLQAIPFRFRLRVPREGRRGNLNYKWNIKRQSVLSYLRALEFLERAAADGELVVRDYLDGTAFPGMILDPKPEVPVDSEFLELLRRVVRINLHFNVPIRIPDRDFFNESDIKSLITLESVMEGGSLDLESVTITWSKFDPSDLLRKNEEESLGALEAGLKNYRLQLLDSVIELGPTRISCPAIRFHPDDVALLRARAGQSFEEGVQIRLVPARNAKLTVCFEKWKTDVVELQRAAKES